MFETSLMKKVMVGQHHEKVGERGASVSDVEGSLPSW